MNVRSRWNRATIWAPMRDQPGRTILAVIAITLGVALGLAIHLINRASVLETTRAANGLFGTADLVIQGASGFDEALYPVIARLPGVAAVSPVVETRAAIVDRREALQLLGIDMLRVAAMQPTTSSVRRSRDDLSVFATDSLLLSAAAAATLHYAVGDTVQIQIGMESIAFTVIGIVPGEAISGYIDIA